MKNYFLLLFFKNRFSVISIYFSGLKRIFTAILLLPLGLFAQENDTLPLEPVFSVPGGIHAGPVKVELSATHKDAKVYYTTNGSTPGTGSKRYKEPIIVDGVKCIRARAYVSGKKPGRVITTIVLHRSKVYLTGCIHYNQSR